MDTVWVVIAPGFPPDAVGGAEVHAHRVALELEQRGYRVVRLRAPVDPVDRLGNLPRHTVVHLHLASDGMIPWIEAVKGRFPLLITLHDATFACPQLFYTRSMGRACNQRDALHCPVCAHRKLISALFSFPLRRMGWDPSPRMRRWRALRHALRSLPDRGVRWIFPSRFLARKFRETMEKEVKGIVLPNFPGVPLERTPPSSLRIWGWMGVFSPGKGVEDLLMGWEQCGEKLYPQGELHLWGRPARGEERWWHRVWSQYRHVRGVIWKGTFAPEDVEDVLREIDGIILPSRVVENCPLVVVDALALGRWVMASDRGGMGDLLPPSYRFAPGVVGVCEAFLRARTLPPPPWPEGVRGRKDHVDRLEALAREVIREWVGHFGSG